MKKASRKHKKKTKIQPRVSNTQNMKKKTKVLEQVEHRGRDH